MWNTDLIGKSYPPFTAEVEKGRIAFFARAIGEDAEIYFDEAAAKQAGYRSIPAPLTFPYSIAMDARQSFLPLDDMAIDITRCVHGEQAFAYHGDICAGDIITGVQTITDMYEKKGGALKFIVTEIQLRNQDDVHVCDLRTVVVVRGG